MMRNCIALLTLPLWFWNTFATAQSEFAPLEKRIIGLQEQIRTAATDDIRRACHDSLRQIVQEAVNSAGCFDYPFDKVKYMAILTSPDEQFRIFNWNVPFEDQTHAYGCFILWKEDEKKGIYNWEELRDQSDDVQYVKNRYLRPDEWFGALYYDIVYVKHRRKPYYMLLGWDGANGLINRKVLEVMEFTRKGIRLGGNVFEHPEERLKRFIFEYAEEVSASLRYFKKDNRIVFDHLSPRTSGMGRNPAFMGPDLTFDAFVLDKNKWTFESDVYVTMGKEGKRKPYVDPRER